jgi:cytochrome P450
MPADPDILRDLRARRTAEGQIFWINDTDLAVFDPEVAARINNANFAQFTLKDKLSDVLRGRTGDPVDWRRVRSVWLARIRTLSEPEQVAAMAGRMRAVLDRRVGQPLNLTWLAYEAVVRSLVPVVLTGLSIRDAVIVHRDIIGKIGVLTTTPDDPARQHPVRSVITQVRAGSVVRREIRGRAAGRRPHQPDLVDPLVTDLLPVLGISRAVEAATAALTAITGPPGSSAASLLYELSRRPEWRARLTDELAPLDVRDLYRAPSSCAPASLRFVKEVLRMWSSPLLLNRRVRTTVTVPEAELRPGNQYVLCPYLAHHDPERWPDPDTFQPDRWNADASPHSGTDFIPFGFAPTSCVGAGLATIQLLLLTHLLCTRYRITVDDPSRARMALLAVATPLDFHGCLTHR